MQAQPIHLLDLDDDSLRIVLSKVTASDHTEDAQGCTRRFLAPSTDRRWGTALTKRVATLGRSLTNSTSASSSTNAASSIGSDDQMPDTTTASARTGGSSRGATASLHGYQAAFRVCRRLRLIACNATSCIVIRSTSAANVSKLPLASYAAVTTLNLGPPQKAYDQGYLEPPEERNKLHNSQPLLTLPPAQLEFMLAHRPVTRLDIAACEGVKDVGLAVIAKHLPRLHALAFATDASMSYRGIAAALSRLSALRTLTVMATQAPRREGRDTIAAVVRGLTHLESLTVENNTTIASAALGSLDKLTSLSRLDLSRCNAAHDLFTIQALSPCPHLLELRISYGIQTKDFIIQHLLQCLPSLTALELVQCHSLSFLALAQLPSMCPRLRHVSLAQCPRMTDEVAECLSGLSGLRSLDMSFCPELSAAALRDLAGCSALRSLDITNCFRVKLSSAPTWPELRKVCFGYCKQITDAQLDRFVRKHPQIEFLNLQGCPDLTDATLRSISAALPRLRALDVSSCKVHGAGVRELANLAQLETLRLRMKVSDRSIRAAAAASDAPAWEDLASASGRRSTALQQWDDGSVVGWLPRRF